MFVATQQKVRDKTAQTAVLMLDNGFGLGKKRFLRLIYSGAIPYCAVRYRGRLQMASTPLIRF